MSKDNRKPTGGDAKSRRELLSATAKLSAFLGAVGLTGVSLGGEAAADTARIKKRPAATADKSTPKLMQRSFREEEMKGLLRDAMRTGDSSAALKRHPRLKLGRRQEAALKRMTRQDWAALRRLQSKLAPLEELAAGDTGYVFW